MHGNAVAFRAALADLEGVQPDLIVSLGDVAQGGPQPVECVELLQELGCACVFGNSDEFLLTLDLGAEAESMDAEHVERVQPWSEYAVLTAEDGRIGVEFRRIPFDVEELVAAAQAADFPGLERWASMWQR